MVDMLCALKQSDQEGMVIYQVGEKRLMFLDVLYAIPNTPVKLAVNKECRYHCFQLNLAYASKGVSWWTTPISYTTKEPHWTSEQS